MRDHVIKQGREAERFARAHELKKGYKDIICIRHWMCSMQYMVKSNKKIKSISLNH